MARELAGLRTRSVRLAEALQASEENLSDLEQRLAELDTDARSKEADFAQRRTQLGRMVAELGRLGRQPAEAALVLPASPMDSARTAKLLGTLDARAARPGERALAPSLKRCRRRASASTRKARPSPRRLSAWRRTARRCTASSSAARGFTRSSKRPSGAVPRACERLSREAQDIRELIERLQCRPPRRRDARPGSCAERGA